MRTLLMASAALIIGSGAALAQSAGTSSAGSTSAGGMSTGSAAGSTMTAPNNAAGSTISKPPTASGSGMASSSAGVLVPPSTNDTNTMAPAATNDSGMTNPGTKPPSASQTGATTKPSISKTSYQASPMHPMHHALPTEASAGKYLHIALKAIKHHDAATADEALSRAETRLLTRAVDASASATPDDSPGVQAVSNARQALKSGNFATAAQDTQQAMSSAGPDSMGMGSGMDTPADRASGIVPNTTSDSGMKNPGSGTSAIAPGGPLGQ